MPVKPGVLDANILAYAIDADAPQNVPSRALLEAARDPFVRLYVTSQIICEFYSVITNPKRVARVTAPADALGIIARLPALPGLHVLPTPSKAVSYLTARASSIYKSLRQCRRMASTGFTLSTMAFGLPQISR